MCHAKYVIPGVIVFLALFTTPFWLNIGAEKFVEPELSLPKDYKECIEATEFMRAEHMNLLNIWRDKAVREGLRTYTASNGKTWDVSLQNTCMECHANKAEFCDKCHNTMNVSPYCWRCHLAPKGNE